MENELSIIKCRRCGKVLPPGSLKYIVQIHITADFDNYITEEEFNEEVPLEKIVESVERQEGRAERDVMDDMLFHWYYTLAEIERDNGTAGPSTDGRAGLRK